MLNWLTRRIRVTNTAMMRMIFGSHSILRRQGHSRTIWVMVLASACTLTSTACVATFSPPSELMSGARQQSIEGRIGRGQAETLRQGDFTLRSIRTGLVSVRRQKGAQVCEVGVEFAYAHGLQNTWIGNCQATARLERGAVVTQALECQLKPLAGKAFSFRVTGPRCRSGRTQSGVSR